ncbi:hypothetical protein ACS0TY_025005 [Phlomoides rotata]
MEKISLSMSSGATRSLDGAQQKGSIILNLKCVVAQCMRLLSVSIDESSELMMFGFETKQLGQGVVYRIKDSSITVAFDDIPEQGLNSPSRLEKLQNEVTYHWMKETLIQLSKGVKDPVADLVPVLFGERPPTVSKPDIKFTLVKSNLDHPQSSRNFLRFQERCYLKDTIIQGPLFCCMDLQELGSLLLWSVVEIILQEVKLE